MVRTVARAGVDGVDGGGWRVRHDSSGVERTRAERAILAAVRWRMLRPGVQSDGRRGTGGRCRYGRAAPTGAGDRRDDADSGLLRASA